MPKKATCEMCGDRFDAKRDGRRWKAKATPLSAEPTKANAKAFIVCTDCFLELAEVEYGAD